MNMINGGKDISANFADRAISDKKLTDYTREIVHIRVARNFKDFFATSAMILFLAGQGAAGTSPGPCPGDNGKKQHYCYEAHEDPDGDMRLVFKSVFYEPKRR